MIGDWVRNALLDEVFKMNTTSMRNMCWDEDNGTARYTIEPIPLTEEILKKNGFKFDGCFWCYHKSDFERVMIRFCSEDEDDMNERAYNFYVNHWVIDENYRIDYVHELQRALRLCGLNDLADNFKV